MPIHKNVYKREYENLTVEELEEIYKEIEQEYQFNSKESQIEYIFSEYLKTKSLIPTYSGEKYAVEELLKEKTGKDYTLQQQIFNLTLEDYIDYLSSQKNFIFDKDILTLFFNKLEGTPNDDKIDFLILLVLSNNFYALMKELSFTNEFMSLYAKYTDICEEFYYENALDT